MQRYDLERPRRRAQLIRLLADGRHQYQAIARYIGCTPAAITFFKARHKAEIEAMQQGFRDATDHLYIAHKANRVTALDQMHSDLQDLKRKRVEDARVPEQVIEQEPMRIGEVEIPVQPMRIPARDRDMAHGYETTDYKEVGGRVFEIRKFDQALLRAELEVMREAAEELGQRQVQPQSTPPSLTQNNNNLYIFDRPAFLKALKEAEADA